MTAVSRPRGDVERDAAQRVDRRVALAVAADESRRRHDSGRGAAAGALSRMMVCMRSSS